MWSIGNPFFNSVTSFFSTLVPSESSEQVRLDRFKRMYDDVIHIVNEMREHGEVTGQDWIRSSNILQDLNQMIDILVEEEKELKQEVDINGTKADLCMDYLLKQQIIDALCGIAMVDDPTGSTEIITQHLTRLFREVQYPLLSSGTVHISVSALVQKLIQIYQGDSVSSSLEFSIVKFIEIVCEKLCDDPVLINSFFLRHGTDSTSPKPTSSKAIRASFPLVEPLIPHINDTSSLGTTSRKVLLLLIAFPLSDITEYLTFNTAVVKLLAQNLVDAVLQLDSTTPVEARLELPEEILKQRLLFVSEVLLLCKNTQEYKNHPETALILYDSLLQEIESELLKGFFEVELLSIKNVRIVSATRILRMMIVFLSTSPSSPLTDLIIRFLFQSNLLLSTLLSRMNNNNNAISIATLQLFNTLLRTQHPFVMKLLLPEISGQEAILDIPPERYFELFMNNFQECLPHIDVLLKNDHSGSVGNMMKDVEYDMMLLKETKMAIPTADVELKTTPFMKILQSRIKMFLRQSMEVNLEVSQIITTISMIASPALFSALFITKNPLSFVQELDTIWVKAIQRSKELINFERYLKVTETNLNMCEQSIGIQREDRLSVDVTFSQFLEGYVVLREFLTELSYSIKVRGSLQCV